MTWNATQELTNELIDESKPVPLSLVKMLAKMEEDGPAARTMRMLAKQYLATLKAIDAYTEAADKVKKLPENAYLNPLKLELLTAALIERREAEDELYHIVGKVKP